MQLELCLAVVTDVKKMEQSAQYATFGHTNVDNQWRGDVVSNLQIEVHQSTLIEVGQWGSRGSGCKSRYAGPGLGAWRSIWMGMIMLNAELQAMNYCSCYPDGQWDSIHCWTVVAIHKLKSIQVISEAGVDLHRNQPLYVLHCSAYKYYWMILSEAGHPWNDSCPFEAGGKIRPLKRKLKQALNTPASCSIRVFSSWLGTRLSPMICEESPSRRIFWYHTWTEIKGLSGAAVACLCVSLCTCVIASGRVQN